MSNIGYLQYFSLTRYRVVEKFLKKNNYSLILDMEDSAQNIFSKKKTVQLKEKCRFGLSYLVKNNISIKDCFVRINAIESEFFDDDLILLQKLSNKIKIKGIFLPKVKNYDVIKFLYEKIKIKIIPIIETSKGYANLNEIVDRDKENYIYGIHYGHFDYCLSKKIWPFPEPYHQEYWKIIQPIIKCCNNYNKKFILTPYPLVNNHRIYWSIVDKLKNLCINDCYVSVVSINNNFFNRPKIIKKLSLKKISLDKKFILSFTKKIIREYVENMQNNKSFCLTKKRFIPPHQYLMAKKYLKKNDS
ncbi:aldolase/citrate lyase family protein [Candidatus Pelagibacter sp.]|nr:aldolase/citrate lyase family protein [Candidatus Pelagibacter sp.]